MLAVQNETPVSDIVIYEADFALRRKLGGWESLASLLTPQVIAEAEKTVAALEPDLLAQILVDVDRLNAVSETITPDTLPMIIEASFAIKSRAGFCNYPLASALAKSLHVYCEMFPRDKSLGPKEAGTIHCLVNAVTTVFNRHVTGAGGKTGEAIAAELKRLAVRFVSG